MVAGVLSMLVVFGVHTRAAESDAPSPGEVAKRIVCSHDSAQSYALYLPSNYTDARVWPVLYCFDPRGWGHRPVEIFREAAERHGFIVAGSNNSRNGPWQNVDYSSRSLLGDVQRRFRVDPRRQYAAGFSGGARAACAAALQFGLAGVVGCGAGFPEGPIPKKIDFVYFGAAGLEDFNYLEVAEVADKLASRKVPQRFAVFAGRHEWLPPALAAEALTWLELQAMRSGLRPRDDGFSATEFRTRVDSAKARPTPGESYQAFVEIAADFAGLCDITDVDRQAAALKKSKEVRKHLSTEKRRRERERDWVEKLYAAVYEALHPEARQASAAAILEQSGMGQGAAGGDSGGRMDGSSPGGGGFGGGLSVSRADFVDSISRDRFLSLRELASELQGAGATNPAARRVLNRGFSFAERAYRAAEDRDFSTALTYCEAAAILNPEAPEIYFVWARTCAKQGDARLARSLLATAIEKGFSDRDRIRQLEESL